MNEWYTVTMDAGDRTRKDVNQSMAQPPPTPPQTGAYKSYFMCSKCQYNSHMPAGAGYCHSCRDKVCVKCRTRHGKPPAARPHVTVKLQCARCMKNQQTTVASALCTECQCYLCSDCAYRHKELCSAPPGRIAENVDTLVVHAGDDEKTGNEKEPGTKHLNNVDDESTDTESVHQYDTHIGVTCKKNRQQRAIRLKVPQLFREFDPTVNKDRYISEISQLLFLPNSNLLLFDSTNRKLKMFQMTVNVKCVSVLKIAGDLWNICASNKYQSEVYASFLNGKTIAVIDTESRLKVQRILRPEVTCRGVTCWHSGIAVVAVVPRAANVDGQHELLLLDYNGAVKHRITQSTMNTSHYLTPHHLTSINGGSEIVISHYGERALTFYDVVGAHVKTECDMEGLAWPGAMTMDEDGNVYVIAGEVGRENIHQLSADGRYMGVIMQGRDGILLKGLAYDVRTRTMAVQLSDKKSRIPGNIGIFWLT